ncbi:hypothetical protein GCM10010191_72850 [Actinomadura vinacea]|uniref:Uncharacterized protein n=1 Tax=Actinomadura vinacea TaxID=115336 RepID=A0ABP5X8Q2_9ACTN
MYVIRLPDGRLRVPHSVLADSGREPDEGQIIAQAYVEIGPGDPDYERLLPESITEEEMADKRREWREGDEELLRVFEEYKADQGED